MPVNPGAIEVISALREQRFGDEMYLVSKAGRRVEDRTRQWLQYIDFFGRTGINDQNMHFCRKRSEKLPIAQELQLTHFIDDRRDVLDLMPSLMRIWFTFDKDEESKLIRLKPSLTRAYGWAAVKDVLLESSHHSSD